MSLFLFTVTSDEIITDPAALNSYLKSVEEKERKYNLGKLQQNVTTVNIV